LGFVPPQQGGIELSITPETSPSPVFDASRTNKSFMDFQQFTKIKQTGRH